MFNAAKMKLTTAVFVALGVSLAAAFNSGSNLPQHGKLRSFKKIEISTSVLQVSASGMEDLVRSTSSKRLEKARLRVAEAQGIIPIGASENPENVYISLDELVTMAPSQSKVREISWRVAEPEVKYDPIRAQKDLYVKPFQWIRRNIEIFVPMTFFTLSVIGDILTGQEEANRSKRAERILDIISQQSPALIKGGQALASRPDLLPKEYLDALQKLQDRCPAYPTEEALALFERELGFPPEEVFEITQYEPVAAASIGQVYRAKIRSNGAEVAIKIQRPDCEKRIALDLFVLRWYSNLVENILGLLGRKISLVAVIDDFGDLIYREMDYRAEAVNAQRFAELYANIPDVFVPKVYSDLSTSKILTMEWVTGARLSDGEAIKKMNLKGERFVDILVQCSIRQMLENGFFHADPHGGNLLAMESGKLCFLDFGMVSYVEAPQRYSIIEAVVHLVNRDFRALAELYRRMGFIPLDVDLEPLVLALDKALPDVLNAPVGELNIKNIIGKLGDVMFKFPFSLPPYYIAIIRCLGVLEGVALQVDEDFRILDDAYPYIASRLLTDPSEELQAALQQLLFQGGQPRWERLQDLLEKSTGVQDYDAAQAGDRLIAFMASDTAGAVEVREVFVQQAISFIDRVSVESGELALQTLLERPQDAIAQVGTLLATGQQRGPEAVLEEILAMLLAQEKSTGNSAGNGGSPAVSGLVKVLRLLNKSQALSADQVLQFTRKSLREPALVDMMSQIIASSAETNSVRFMESIIGV